MLKHKIQKNKKIQLNKFYPKTLNNLIKKSNCKFKEILDGI